MKTSCIAGCLVVSLVGMELCESKEIHFVDDRTVSIQPRSAGTLAWNPHTHFEVDTEARATTAAPIFASGHQVEEMFRLFIYPAASGFKLIGYPVSAEPDGMPPQLMYGFSPSVESLTELLSSRVLLERVLVAEARREGGLPQAQLLPGCHRDSVCLKCLRALSGDDSMLARECIEKASRVVDTLVRRMLSPDCSKRGDCYDAVPHRWRLDRVAGMPKNNRAS